MAIFITGTDTNVGKTLISSWLCLHSAYEYYKVVQTGTKEGFDKDIVVSLSGAITHKEAYSFEEPLSPHLAAQRSGKKIEASNIFLPKKENLIIEGAGGVLVPLNDTMLLVDLMQQWNIPTLLVAKSTLGTINHTLLSLEALYARKIAVLGILLNGPLNPDNAKAIEWYSKTKVLAQFPQLKTINQNVLSQIALNRPLQSLLKLDHES